MVVGGETRRRSFVSVDARPRRRTALPRIRHLATSRLVMSGLPGVSDWKAAAPRFGYEAFVTSVNGRESFAPYVDDRARTSR